MMMKEERFVQNILKIANAIPHRNARSQRHVMIEWKDRKIFGQWRKRENEKGKEEIFGEGTYFVSRQDADPHPPVSPQCCSPCCSHCPLTFQGKFYLSFSPQKPLLRNYFVIALQELHSYTL